MTAIAQRTESLGRWGAPPAVQALALALEPQAISSADERAAGVWLAVADWASRRPHGALAPLPEVAQLLELERRLSPALGVLRSSSVAATTAAPAAIRVARTYEATTPLITARASFAAAAKLADDRSQWAIGAPQMTIDTPLSPLLPADGKLWRGRLSKHTDLLLPLAAGLATHETIEIAAEGLDRPDGSGFRRYEHFLHHSDEGPGLLTLQEDSGWIELRGSATSLVLRIHKRVTVLLPEPLEQTYGAALPLALSTLLWLWAEGFLKQVALPEPAPPPPNRIGLPEVPPEVKRVQPQPDGQGGRIAHVAVLGGGPAGLACAWMLSNPGGALWHGPGDLSLKVTLIEKSDRLGGKAASSRRAAPGDERIEEHGLHVLMGCYRNLRRMLAQVGASGNLVARQGTRIPVTPPDSAADGVTVELGPWPEVDPPEPIAEWFGKLPDASSELSFLPPDINLAQLWTRPLDERWTDVPPLQRTLYELGHARQQPRPLLRLTARLWAHVAGVLAHGPLDALDPSAVQHLGMHLLFKRLARTELVAQSRMSTLQVAAQPQAPDFTAPDQLVPLASLLRTLARAALPGDSPHADVRLVGDAIELATTVAIGLAHAGLFPNWAIGRIDEALGDDYTQWARAVQSLDTMALDDWLLAEGADTDYPARSRLLDAVTAGLFTTPAGIAAGTFVHGLIRLFFSYGDTPYLMLEGGTGEAVIKPIADSMNGKATLQLPRVLTGLAFAADGSVTGVTTTNVKGHDPQTLPVDAAVLAIPPFGGALDGLGLPEDLTHALQPIGHVATLSIQHWTTQPARFPGVIVSGLGTPMRCVATMDHLQGQEGANIPNAPVYYCGEVDDTKAELWDTPEHQLAHDWLAAHAGDFQAGASVPLPTVKVNRLGSDRYVSANPATQRARRLVFQTGVPNLWLAGDWTRNAFSCGAIEGAVSSGLEAARHLLWQLGCTVDFPITGPMFDKDPV